MLSINLNLKYNLAYYGAKLACLLDAITFDRFGLTGVFFNLLPHQSRLYVQSSIYISWQFRALKQPKILANLTLTELAQVCSTLNAHTKHGDNYFHILGRKNKKANFVDLYYNFSDIQKKSILISSNFCYETVPELFCSPFKEVLESELERFKELTVVFHNGMVNNLFHSVSLEMDEHCYADFSAELKLKKELEMLLEDMNYPFDDSLPIRLFVKDRARSKSGCCIAAGGKVVLYSGIFKELNEFFLQNISLQDMRLPEDELKNLILARWGELKKLDGFKIKYEEAINCTLAVLAHELGHIAYHQENKKILDY